MLCLIIKDLNISYTLFNQPVCIMLQFKSCLTIQDTFESKFCFIVKTNVIATCC